MFKANWFKYLFPLVKLALWKIHTDYRLIYTFEIQRDLFSPPKGIITDGDQCNCFFLLLKEVQRHIRSTGEISLSFPHDENVVSRQLSGLFPCGNDIKVGVWEVVPESLVGKPKNRCANALPTHPGVNTKWIHLDALRMEKRWHLHPLRPFLAPSQAHWYTQLRSLKAIAR